jgi:hypothetical protein
MVAMIYIIPVGMGFIRSVDFYLLMASFPGMILAVTNREVALK